MADKDEGTLPYRGDWASLEGLVEGLGMGRELGKVAAALGLKSKSLHGIVLAAERLGLVEQGGAGLTATGRNFALTRNPQERREIVLQAILDHEPYQLLLDYIFRTEEETTPVEHFITWWATSGYGASENNRVEAAAAFANLLDGAGAGSFIRGRRGGVSRIEWNPDVRERLLLALRTPKHQLEQGKFENTPADDRQDAGKAAPPADAELPGSADEEDLSSREVPIPFRVSDQCTAYIYFKGKPTQSAIERLIKYLEVSKETYPAENH